MELDFRHIQIGMGMDVSRREAVEGVLKGLAIFGLTYNLVRSVMMESARARAVDADRIGLVDAVRWLIGPEGGAEPVAPVVNPSRRGRVAPRAVERRPKQDMRLTKPRAELRKELPNKHF